MFPLPFTVGLHSYSDGPDDGYGNHTRVFTPPLDEPGVEYRVAGWADLFLPSATEKSGNMNRVISFLQLFAPKDFPATAYDRIDLDGEQWEVLGEPNRYSNGPFWDPGMSVWNLQKVTG